MSVIPSDIGAAFRLRLAAMLVRGRDSRTTLEPRLGADAVGASPATYTLLGPGGAVLVDAAEATVTDGVVSYTVPASVLVSTLAFGPRYREVWSVTVAGVPCELTRPAILARYALHCPITQADLELDYPDLADTFRMTPDNLQGFIDAAWEELIRKMSQAGVWAATVVDGQDLADTVRNMALHKLFRFRSVEGGESDRRLSDDHKAAADAAWSSFTTRLDLDQDGEADSDQRESLVHAVHPNGAPTTSLPRWA